MIFPELLDRTKLDYSVESLHEVDRYCCALHERKAELGGPALARSVIWGGAYVGEVLRRSARIPFNWVDYHDYVKAHPAVLPHVGPRTPQIYAFLCKPSEAMNTPLNKMSKCIANGIEDSVHFHVSAELLQQDR